MSSLKRLANDTALYGISSILGRVLNYLLVPLYTTEGVFPPGEYGVVTELYAYVAFFNVLFTYGMETTYFRFSSRKEYSEQQIFNNAFTSILITSVIFGIALWLAAPFLLNSLDHSEARLFHIEYLVVIIAIDALVAIPFARLRAQNKALYFASARLINIFINIGLNLFFLLGCPAILSGQYGYLNFLQPLAEAVYNPDFGVGYVFLSNLIANALYLPMLFPLFLKAKLAFDKHLLQPMLVYAYPLLLMGIAGVTNEMFSRPMLRYLLPDNFYQDYDKEAAVGIFGACYKLSVFMNLAIQAFRFAAEPFFFAKASDKNSPQLFGQVMHYFVIVCCLIFFAVTVNLPWLAPIFLRNPIYLKGIEVVPVLLLGYLWYGIYLNLTIWFKLVDKTKYGTWFTVTAAIITVILNIALIPIWGYMGAAIVTLVVFFYMAAICYYYGQKFYPIPYKVTGGLLYIIVSTLVAYAIAYILPEEKVLAAVLGILACLLFIGFVFLLERKNLATALKH